MPKITAGSSATVSLPAGSVISLDGGLMRFEFPTGTVLFEGDAAGQTFGPYSSTANATITSLMGGIDYAVSTPPGSVAPFVPSSVAITGGTIGNVSVKPTNTIGAIGDSITALNIDNGAGNLNYNIRGYLAHAVSMSGGRMAIGSVAGFSGETAAQIVSRLPAYLATCTDSMVVLFAGANDIVPPDVSLQTAAQVYATLAQGYALIRAAGKVPVACTLLPRSDATTTAQRALRNGINTLLRAQAAAGSLLLVDWANIYEDSAGAISTTLSYDGIHPFMAAESMGYVLWNTLQNYFPGPNYEVLGNYLHAANLLTNGTVTGTGGTLAGGSTGSIATGWTANAVANAASAVCSKVASSDMDDHNEWQQVVLTATAGGMATFDFQQQISGWSVGQALRMAAQIEVDVSDSASLVDFSVRMTAFPSSTSGGHLGSVDTSKLYPQAPTRRRLLASPSFTIPAATTGVFCYVEVRVAASKSATLRFRRAKAWVG